MKTSIQKQKILLLLIMTAWGLLIQLDVQSATVILTRPIALQDNVISLLNKAHGAEKQQWKLVVFGFVHCKDVCPLSLANLALIVKAAAQEKINLDGIFVTIDPDRDTASVLSQYTESFGPNVGYLRLEGEKLDSFKATFGVETIFYTKNEGNLNHYQVDHSTSAFLIDPEGKIRVMFDALKDANNITRLFVDKRTLFSK
ncbi:hypothetical protein W03_13060 [Nitrosomonas sp. PY1]|uniref:SCO family protein n=1 Tax=Nitrosomonas sp. PY1 TaxID=1803906 RepID=UPI001FC7E29D|nr:SCO family protein [Nitrosomonas sp. PY1]GKS69302.1 hypothetical protein W03_13060 [Nitrosomonas sp. PY1]